MDDKQVPLHVTLMGQFKMRYADQTLALDTPSYQALLAYLLLYPDRTHTRQHLAFLIWRDSAESQSRTNLRKALHHLRHTLPQPDHFLQIDRQTVSWIAQAPLVLDVNLFESAVRRAQHADEPANQVCALDTALVHYGGDLLPGHYDDWILSRREALRQRYLECLLTQVELLEAAREYAAATKVARRLLRSDPLHETTYRHLMRLQALDGDRAGALRTYHQCATVLRRELDIAPSAATREAYGRLLALETTPEAQSALRIPLVGRDSAWKALLDTWRRVAYRQPLFALVRGEAGIGKTRLAEELLDWAERQGIPTLSTHCHAPASSLPYAPVTDWLRDATIYPSLNGLDDKWLRELSRVLPELVAERADLTPAGPITENWQRQHLFTALAHAVLRQRQPFILFIDDLQWCDPDTLQWLAFLLSFDAQARFLLLGTARTEEMLDAPALLTLCADARHENRVVEIELGRLDMADSTSLAAHVLADSLTDTLPDYLFTLTEGVPLFVVELARAGFHELAGMETEPFDERVFSADNLPRRIQSVFETRLTTLSAPARELADLVATIGRSFTFDLVATASSMNETELVRALDELWRQRIVREQDADAYDFSHGLLRQVTYGSLSAAHRRLLHGQIVQALEARRQRGQSVDDGQLARHYVAIGRSHDAIPCLQRAAAAAQRIFAHQEALANLQQALSLAVETNSDDKELLVLFEQQADIFSLVGQYDAAHDAFESALTHADAPLDRARLLRKQGKAWMAQHQRLSAMDAFDAALCTLAPQPEPPDAQWQQAWLDVQLARGDTFYFDARLDDLALLIEQLDAVVDAVGTPEQRRLFLELQNMLMLWQKRYRLDAEDIALRQRIFDLAEQIGDPHQIAASRFSLGFHYLWSGSIDQAISDLTIALADATGIGNLYVQDQCLAYLALAYRQQGDTKQVEAIVTQHRPIVAQVGNPLYGGVLAGNQAWLAYKAGEWDSAERAGIAALTTWGKRPYPFKGTALWPLLAVALAQNRLADAVEYAGQLLAPTQYILDTPIDDALQQAIKSWAAGETTTTLRHLTDAITRAQTNHTF